MGRCLPPETGAARSAFRGARFANFHRDVRGNNDLLILTQPQAIEDIHADYLRAGADIVATNTFNSNAISLSDYGITGMAREINLAAARLTRACADAARLLLKANGSKPFCARRLLMRDNSSAAGSVCAATEGINAASKATTIKIRNTECERRNNMEGIVTRVMRGGEQGGGIRDQ